MPPTDAARHAGPTRRTPAVLLAVAAVLLAARIAAGVWDAHRAPPGPGDRVAWVPIEHAEARARAEGKPLLYDFTAEWCPPCRAMRRDVFADERLADFIGQRFVPVRVLDRQREEGRNARAVDSLQRVYRVDGFPTLVVAWPGSDAREVASGYRGRDLTAQWLTAAESEVRRRAGVPAAPVAPGR
jgi:protein disulfide-isomerase